MSVTAKVTRHIPDIAPNLTLRRDKPHIMYPANRKRYALPSMEMIREIEPNYTWTRLPDLCGYKSAIVRNKVCEGLMYLLPGDKNGTSLARPYTADLGAMFHEPYLNFKPSEYNEENVKQSSDIHFSPTTHISRLNKYRTIKQQPFNLNSESKQRYCDYNTLVRKKEEGEGRSKDNLLIAVKAGKAEEALQQEVQMILDEVGVHNVLEQAEEADVRPYSSLFNSVKSRNTSGNNNIVTPSNNIDTTQDSDRKSVKFSIDGQQTEYEWSRPTTSKVKDFRQHQYTKKSAKFKDFKELREAEVPRPQLPDHLKSRFLSESKIEEIWNWLHWDFSKSKFEHFIEVCS